MTDIIYMGISAFASFIFKYMANSQEDRHKQNLDTINMHKVQEVSIQNARNFQPNSYVRRFIAISFTVVFLYMISRVGYITYIDKIDLPSYFFGMFGGGQELVIKQIMGPVLIESFITLIYVIVGFYFGSNLGNRK